MAKSFWLKKFDTKARLPFRLTLKLHEELVDFVHGSLIGLLLGFLIGALTAGNI